MITIRNFFIAFITIFGLFPVLYGATNVDFTLSTVAAVDGGAVYTGFNAADAGTATENVIGFQIAISKVNGVTQSPSIGPVAAFCSEIQETIGTTTYTNNFTASSLATLSAGRAGEAGTASSSIPSGGIGSLRAAYLTKLFDDHYISADLNAWTQTATDPNLHAFQLAVWEITHDDGLNLSTGALSVGTQNNTLRDNAINLAQTWLTSIIGSSIDATYTSTQFDFWALTSTSGNTSVGSIGYQDVILALEKETPAQQEFESAVPEPSSAALLLGLSALALTATRRRAR